jgi:hypothetical protein
VAGALAACTRNANQPVAPPHNTPTPPPVATQVLGEMTTEELGDAGVVVEKLGEVARPQQPPAPPAVER